LLAPCPSVWLQAGVLLPSNFATEQSGRVSGP
jgi:hypothetical protein